MKKKIFLALFILMALVMMGCTSGNNSNPFDNVSEDSSDGSESTDISDSGSGGSGALLLTPVPVLFGVAPTYLQNVEASNVAGYKEVNGMGSSSLYLINPLDGSAVLIGDIGYNVAGIAYNAITGKLYGITLGIGAAAQVKTTRIAGSQLIEIDTKTGAGTYIADIIGREDRVLSKAGTKGTSGQVFTTPTFDISGTLYAIQNNNNSSHYLCTINLTTGLAECSSTNLSAYSYGLAFNNLDTLYLITNFHGPKLYQIDTDNGSGVEVGAISGLPDSMARDGDFDPLTGKYWGLDTYDYVTSERHLLVIDINSLTLEHSIRTIDYLQAITFGYMDMATLMSLGLTNMIDSFDHTNPE